MMSAIASVASSSATNLARSCLLWNDLLLSTEDRVNLHYCIVWAVATSSGLGHRKGLSTYRRGHVTSHDATGDFRISVTQQGSLLFHIMVGVPKLGQVCTAM